MKVLLIYPTNPDVASEPSLGLMYIASALREAGHDPRIIEGTLSDVKKHIQHSQLLPDFVGIGCMTSQYHEIIKMRDFLHEFDVPVIFGGPHASVLPDSLLDAYGREHDFVVTREGEKTIVKIVEGELSPGVVPGEVIENLDSLSFPARDLIPRKYLAHHKTTIMASRGCPFNCTFCQPTLRKVFGNKVRRRTVGNVISEMLDCLHKFRVNHFQFYDDTFPSSHSWVYDFCDEVEARIPKKEDLHFAILSRVDMLDRAILERLKNVGMNRLLLGFESGSQEILNSLNKGITVEQSRKAVAICKDLKIQIHGFFILGALDETLESIQATKDFIKEVNPDTLFITICTPMPATQLYDSAKAQGRLLMEWDEMDIMGNLSIAVRNRDLQGSMKLKFLSNEDVIKAKYQILREYYLRKVRNPIFILNFLRQHSLRYGLAITKNYLRKF